MFVQQGGVLIIESGTLAAGTLDGGAGGAAGGVGGAGGTGEAFGSGLFIQGNQSITLDPPSSQSLTISGTIADQTGAGGTGTNGGAGALVVNGPGIVILSAQNSYTGGTTLGGDARLELNTGATPAAATSASAAPPPCSSKTRPASSTPSTASPLATPSTSRASATAVCWSRRPSSATGR